MSDVSANPDQPVAASRKGEGVQPPAPTSADGPQGGVHPFKPLLIAALYLGGFFLFFTPLVGVILAHVWKAERETSEWEAGHFTYLIRTFWGSVLATIGAFVAMVVVMLTLTPERNVFGGEQILFYTPIMIIACFYLLMILWFFVRSVISLAKAGSGKPIPDPRSLIF